MAPRGTEPIPPRGAEPTLQTPQDDASAPLRAERAAPRSQPAPMRSDPVLQPAPPAAPAKRGAGLFGDIRALARPAEALRPAPEPPAPVAPAAPPPRRPRLFAPRERTLPQPTGRGDPAMTQAPDRDEPVLARAPVPGDPVMSRAADAPAPDAAAIRPEPLRADPAPRPEPSPRRAEPREPSLRPQNQAAPGAVEARGLGLTYVTSDGPVVALRDVNLTIAPGDFVSFIGPSGCGKTTLLRLIADLEQPTSGSLAVRGISPRQARLSRAYGYVFQAAGLLPWRTIEGNVRLPLQIMGYSRAEQAARAARTLALVKLDGFARKYPWQLSGGMQQRASIARALAFDADLLLMDEPFGALDEISRDHLNEQLLALWAATGKTVCFVTHSIPEAVYLSTRIVVMSPRPGRITDIIESPLPRERPLEIRETPEFLAVAARVRVGLRAGHGDD